MLTERVLKIYADKEEEVGKEVIRELERVMLLRVVDSKWTTHIDDMDELKKGISLRAYGQKNPVVEYRYEGFEMFDAMVDTIREDTVRMLLDVLEEITLGISTIDANYCHYEGETEIC